MNAPPADDAAQEPAGPPDKADPETLVLRGRPPRVVRFKRSVIVALAAFGAGGVVLAAWVALQPPDFSVLAEREDPGEPAKAPADALADLPDSYADAPQLGPPLPGDLGRAIVAHERSSGVTDSGVIADEQERAAQAERERIAAERRSARQSSLLVEGAGQGREPSKQIAAPILEEPPTSEPTLAGAASPARTSEARFVAEADTGADVNPYDVQPAASPYLLSAGSVVAASLITGLRSDLPGLVIAQVTERVYDSPTGRVLVIPQGARLIGRYDDAVAFGQRRALIIWQRIVFPGGHSLRLGNVPATDAAGRSGLQDEVDFHTGSLFKGAAIATLLGVGANLTIAGESDVVQALRESAQQNVSRAGDQLVSRNLQIQPTITIRPGAPVRLVVHRDLVLDPRAE